jgi:glucose/arabinose dehydrogenase
MKMRVIQATVLLGLAACGSSATTTTGASNAQAQAPSPALSDNPPFTATPVATFDDPWAMAFLPGATTALVTEKPGHIWLVDVKTGAKKSVAGAPQTVDKAQGGLLDIALSPTFSSDSLVYLTFSEASANGGRGLALATAKLTPGPGAARLDGLHVIWRDPAGGSGGQFGAVIAFAPDGKSLFLSSGERQRFTPAQDPNQPLGKILHLTLDGKPAPGNPWAGKPGAATVTVTDPPDDTEQAKHTTGRQFRWPGPNLTPAETWSFGHRNPYGLAFAPDGRLWETEMGPQGGDELNLILPGKNYGWPLVSEGENYDGVPIPKHATRPDIVPPKLYWVPSISPTSLLFYTGNLFPQWKGSALIGSLSGQVLARVSINGDQARKLEQWDMGSRIRFVGQGPDGAIYLLEDGPGGRMLRLTPAQTRR